ncbi:hypothetical protein BCR33DRAFT_792632 [Rhizoclosmatium globosum]|uniref:Uncharacterized protein n=1 Tax=Rhizoclosmatium globosum TaxID=329046 RepID=A0A1Y2B7J8_9FUNG|nr:hypothetical protein BCR33DRAFT_792632 [Rhizoclosmatium globosum]|eukprot:ORY30520.1 hypothetical protein BCR33DRAFT_792632 [Rhizoclosmatium globosum]
MTSKIHPSDILFSASVTRILNTPVDKSNNTQESTAVGAGQVATSDWLGSFWNTIVQPTSPTTATPIQTQKKQVKLEITNSQIFEREQNRTDGGSSVTVFDPILTDIEMELQGDGPFRFSLTGRNVGGASKQVRVYEDWGFEGTVTVEGTSTPTQNKKDLSIEDLSVSELEREVEVAGEPVVEDVEESESFPVFMSKQEEYNMDGISGDVVEALFHPMEEVLQESKVKESQHAEKEALLQENVQREWDDIPILIRGAEAEVTTLKKRIQDNIKYSQERVEAMDKIKDRLEALRNNIKEVLSADSEVAMELAETSEGFLVQSE